VLCLPGFLFDPAVSWAEAETSARYDPSAVTEQLAKQLLPASIEVSGGMNAVFSPFGLAVVLHILAGGADKATEEEFRDLLGIRGLPTESALLRFSDYLKDIGWDDRGVTFQSFNGLWCAPDAPPLPRYSDLVRRAFQAQVEVRDFSKPETISQINAWFAQRTQTLIPQMFSTIPDDTKIVLANALYFRGQWSMPFSTGATKTEPFRVAEGQAVDVPMMQQSRDRFLYSRASGYEAIKLPFGRKDFEVIIALPDVGQQPTLDIAKLVSSMLDDVRYTARSGHLFLPRLDLTVSNNIKSRLESLGLRNLFSDAADFSKLTRSQVDVNEIIQRIVLKWDEQGAEAAAGTGSYLVRQSAERKPEPFLMIVNRPFVFVLRHIKSRAVILVGLVNNPAASDH
jgi:serpin B